MMALSMKRFLLLFFLGLIGTGVFLHTIQTNFLTQSNTYQQATAIAAIATTTDSIDEQIAAMTVEEKIGQLFIVGHWREDDYYHMSNLIRAYHLGGVILMGIDSQYYDEVPTWVEVWQKQSKLPLMIATDQEGGAVSRFRSENYTLTPQPEITDSTEALAIAQKRAQELRQVSVNTNLAPVLERSVDPFAFLFERTFRDPDKITALGQAMIVGMRSEGVVAVPKHFPGHEDTPVDSHVELPVLSVSTTTFALHIRDFQNVIRIAKPEALMTAHVLLPAIDPHYPATLSHTLLTKKLRQEIDFTGVIMTDDMGMGAITNTYTPAEAAVLAFQAGADMILFAALPNQAIDAIAALQAAIETGAISEDRLNGSVRRILEMKAVY